MRGHEPLLAMRRAGFRPQAVYMTVGVSPLWRDWPQYGNRASIEIEPGDAVNRLDLRCVFGLPVHIDGYDEDRVADLHRACIVAKASRVLSTVYKAQQPEPKVVRLLDSDGVLEGVF